MFLMEGGVFRSALKEVTKRCLQMPQASAERRHTGHLVEPRGLRLLFQRGERRRGVLVAQAFLPLIVGVGAQPQRPVVDETRAAKRPRQHSGLRGCRVAAVAIGAFLAHALTFSHSNCKTEMSQYKETRRRFIPMPQGRDLHAGELIRVRPKKPLNRGADGRIRAHCRRLRIDNTP